MEEKMFELLTDFTTMVPAESIEESFSFSSFSEAKSSTDFDDHELFFDMDVTLPLRLKETPCDSHSLFSEVPEFEFSMSFCGPGSVEPPDVSPADDLFYKGQLLPLHPPPRLHMAEDLSSPEVGANEEIHLSSLTLSCYLQPGDQKASLTLNAHQEGIIDDLNSRRLTPKYLGCNFWEGPFVVKGFGKSESSEFNGCSQDSCFNRKAFLPEAQDPYVFPNCYKDPTLLCETPMNDREIIQRKNLDASVSRRPYLRWRLLLPGLKKSEDVEIDGKCGDHGCTERLTNAREHRRSSSILKFKASGTCLSSLFTGELGKGRAPKDDDEDHQVLQQEMQHFPGYPGRKLAANGLHRKTMSSFVEAAAERPFVSRELKFGDRDKLVSKVRNCLQKYLKILRPIFMKLEQKIERSGLFASVKMENFPGGNGNTKDLHLAKESETQLHQFLFGNESLYTPLSRRSSSCNSISSSHSSPNHSCAFRATSSEGVSRSTNMELHSAIQGAIAHCKQSQGG